MVTRGFSDAAAFATLLPWCSCKDGRRRAGELGKHVVVTLRVRPYTHTHEHTQQPRIGFVAQGARTTSSIALNRLSFCRGCNTVGERIG